MPIYSFNPTVFIPNQRFGGYDFGNATDAEKNELGGGVLEKQSRRFDDSFQQTTPAAKNNETVTSSSSLYNFEQSLSKSADVQIKTQEGDVVTISFSQLEENSQSAFQVEQGDSKISAYSENKSFERDFSITVEGDLNEKEQQSIQQFIKKVSKVSNDFFKGNVNAAFKQAINLGFNSKQISSFSLDLRTEETVQAIAAYKQTTFPAQNVDQDLLRQANDFVTEVEEFVADSSAILESLVNPKKSVFDVFSGFGALYSAEDVDSDSGNERSLFLDIIEDITNQQFDK